MLEKPEKIFDKNYINIFSIFIASLLILVGFVGPDFWNKKSPKFNFLLVQRDLEKNDVIVNKLDKFNLNKNYLSSDQINEKDKVISWSNQIIKNIENQIPLARMYFPHIPKNIDKLINSYEHVIFELKIRDLLIFDGNLIHKSNLNKSKKCRVVGITRLAPKY